MTSNYYRDSLRSLLDDAELARVDALLADAPASVSFGMWFAERGHVLIGAKLDGMLAGWLMVPAVDETEARMLGETLADGLARCYAPLRDAREATRLLLRRVAH